MASVSRPRTGKGEIVPRRYALESARREFFAALWELVPEALEASNEIATLAASGAATAWERALLAMVQWQEAYRLTDRWGFNGPMYLMKAEGYFAGFQSTSVYEGRERSRGMRERDGVTVTMPGRSPYIMRSGMLRESDSYAVLMAHLLYSDHEYDEWPGDADIGEYDPRGETEDEAVARILPILERRLRYGLQQIAEGDTAGDTIPTSTLPPRHHFEWTVRYQVKGESFAAIARSDRISDSRVVSDAVHTVAELIGLTLRERDKGGRPRNQIPARKANCIAIPRTGKTPAPVNALARKQVFP